MSRTESLFMLIIGAGTILAGCKGPIGAIGPMGPAGPGTSSPVYFFNQNFDSSSYNPTSQFTLVPEDGGTEDMSLGSSDFVSAPNSLSVSSSTGSGPGAGVYTSPGEFSYVPGYDYYLDTYVAFGGMSGTNVKSELILVVNGSTEATVGCVASTNEIYTYNNGNVVNLAVYSGFIFQHFILYWNHSTGFSSITIDGSVVAENLIGARAAPLGVGPNCAGICFPDSTNINNYILLDNLSIYHY